MKESEWREYVANVNEPDLSDEEFDWYHDQLRKRRMFPVFYQWKEANEETPKIVGLVKQSVNELAELALNLAETLQSVLDENERLRKRLLEYEQ